VAIAIVIDVTGSMETDASPYEDADVVGISDRLKAKEIIFSAIITGDCSNRESWNNISE
jgi:hypothetical protein